MRRHIISRHPDAKTLQLYRRMCPWWKVFVILSPGEKRLMCEILEQRFSGIRQEAQNMRKAQIIGFLKGVAAIACVLVLLILILLAGGAGL